MGIPSRGRVPKWMKAIMAALAAVFVLLTLQAFVLLPFLAAQEHAWVDRTPIETLRREAPSRINNVALFGDDEELDRMVCHSTVDRNHEADDVFALALSVLIPLLGLSFLAVLLKFQLLARPADSGNCTLP